MARGNDDIRRHLAGRATPAPRREQVEVAAALASAKGQVTHNLQAYQDRVQEFEQLRRDLIDQTGTVMRSGGDAIFAAYPDVMGICFTEEADPYYDENCSVQLGDRWSGGGLLVRQPNGELIVTNDHPAYALSGPLITGLSDEALTAMYGNDGHAVLMTRTQAVTFDMEGSVLHIEPGTDADEGTAPLIDFIDQYGGY